MRDDRWGEPDPLFFGDGMVDLHFGAGTEWRRTTDGLLYPTCPCHCPDALKPAEATATGRTATARSSDHPSWADPHVAVSAATSPEPDADGMRALLNELLRLLKRTP